MKVVLSIVIAFFIIGCSESAQKESQTVETQKAEIVEEKTTLDTASDAVLEAKEELTEQVIDAKDAVVETVNEVAGEIEEAVNESEEAVINVVDSIEEVVADISGEEIDADLLYNKCASCHGGLGERSALGKSAVIRDWSAKQIEYSLKGYRDGTYGRTMKAMMQAQVKNLSDAELKALSIYIADK